MFAQFGLHSEKGTKLFRVGELSPGATGDFGSFLFRAFKKGPFHKQEQTVSLLKIN